MSASSIGALNTAFMRVTIVFQCGRAALGSWHCMYSAEWHTTQAASAAVKSLVLSHLRPEILGKENATRAIIAREYAGPVAFANDLDCYALPGAAQ